MATCRMSLNLCLILLTAERAEGEDAWFVTIRDEVTYQAEHYVLTDLQLGCLCNLAISGDEHMRNDVADYLYDIAAPGISKHDNLRIVP